MTIPFCTETNCTMKTGNTVIVIGQKPANPYFPNLT